MYCWRPLQEQSRGNADLKRIESLHGWSSWKQALFPRLVNGQSVPNTGLDRTCRNGFQLRALQSIQPKYAISKCAGVLRTIRSTCVWICIEIYLIADPIKFKEHTAAHSQTRHVDVLGIKYGKVLHLRLDIIIISCGGNACNLQMFALQSTELDLMTDDSHACKSSLIWSTTALNVSWNVTHLVYLYGVGLFPCNN